MSSVAELAALREANCRLRDKLLEIAKECESCGGAGVVTIYGDEESTLTLAGSCPIEGGRVEDCPVCADIRALLE